MKQCINCNKLKSEFQFSFNRTTLDGLQNWCKQCTKEHYQKNKELKRNRYLELEYGMFPGEIEIRLKDQNRKCLICKQILNSPQIDHCHITNKIRGLLCLNCNTNLGWYENNSIQEYLNKSKWKFCLIWLSSRNKRDSYLRCKHGICLDDFEMMFKIQNGICGICYKICATGKNLAIDHCHKTERVRGLLCMNCNCNLGWFDNNPVLEYLNDFTDN